MKKHILGFFLVALYTPLVMADVGAVSRALPSGLTGGTGASASSTDAQSATPNTSRATTRAAALSRMSTIPDKAAQSSSTTQSSSVPDATAPTTVRSGARLINVGGATQIRDDNVNARGVAISRAASATSDASTTKSVREKLSDAVNTVGRNSRVSASNINNNPILRRAGVTVRPATADVGGRAKILGTDLQTGSNIGDAVRALQSRAATTTTRETIAEAKERLEQTAELNKSCQEQYNDCMDQFCAVIDANQKRCSCSANLSRYTKVESAVKDANNQLNEVAQRIRYVGLSADEIRAILNETEAEEALSGKKDTTETRNMLADIEKLIRDPKSSASYTADSYSGLEMDLDFSGETSNLFSLDFLNTSNTSFSNLRGTELYNAAKKRCNTVLNQCRGAGATSQQITGNYDLAIDKDCIAYEQGLNKMNETLISNVRSANLMLQKARLAVLQNKNQYDAKGCIAALENCMTDDMVCGDGYTKCLDPTKTYIDENGNVVLGQNITNISKFMTGYNNANIDKTFIDESIASDFTIGTDCATADNKKNGKCIVSYLMRKIGTGQKVTDNGLCRAVLDKCQYYTYRDDHYMPTNDVVVNYIQRAMVNIKAAQAQIISDYASSCMLDIATCYNQQVTQVNAWSSTASAASVRKIMSGACRNVALTCAYAVFANDTTSCPTTNGESACIENISEIFYQSLLCPDNSTYDQTGGEVSENKCGDDVNDGNCWVNKHCKCNKGYAVWGGQCVPACEGGQKRDNYGTCK